MAYGTVRWFNPDGESFLWDVDALPTTAEHPNVVMPNVYWDKDTGLLMHVAAASVLHMATDGKLYRSTSGGSPNDNARGVMCIGPYPCTKPHPHPRPGQE
ncbi:hypothetical protein [Arthrobacter psychrolactophilus]|nr:hypothetical protein [Arthrobacter psychrolactophilus]